MYNKNDKRILFWLINCFVNDEITAKEFCDKYYISFDLEIDFDTFTELEKVIFTEISDTASRFSEFEEDLNKYPGTYFSESQLKRQLVFTQKIFNAISTE